MRSIRRYRGKAGEIFGELVVIIGEPSPYAVRADGDANVLVLDPAALNRLCKQSSDFFRPARKPRHSRPDQ